MLKPIGLDYNDTVKPYVNYSAPMAGDDVGAWFDFDTTEGEQVLVKIGISFVSIENARANLQAEQPSFRFRKIRIRLISKRGTVT